MKEVEIESIEEVPESPDWKGIINTILNVVLVIACVVYVIRFLSLTAHGAEIETAREVYGYDDRKYIVLTPYEWYALTNRVALLEATASRRLAEDYKTAAGREIWHGKATGRKVNPDGLSVTWYYADGFEYTEREVRENAIKRPRPPQAQKRPSGAPAPRKPLDLPPRLAAKRAALLARKQGKPQTVNATFGPGGKVLKVEASK